MIEQAHDPKSVCSVSGLTLQTLEKVGDLLSVDRRDPRLGYTRGNMRLLSFYLNKAKGVSQEVPAWAVQALYNRCERVVNAREA